MFMQTQRASRFPVLRTAPRSRLRWRLFAKRRSRLEPRDRDSKDTLFNPPPLMPPPLPPPSDSDNQREVVGIRQILDEADLGDDTAEELELLESPLPGKFRPFKFHDPVDIHVKENAEGELNLALSFLYDREAHIYAIPHCSEDVPNEFRSYQVMNWDTWVSGDAMSGTEEELQLHKVFFAGYQPLKEGQYLPDVDFDQLYCIDGAKRTIEKPLVHDLRDKNTVDPVLCIKEGDIVIQDTRDCPTMEGYAQVDDLIEYMDTQIAAKEEMAEFDQNLIEENIDFDENNIEEQPDVPESDMI